MMVRLIISLIALFTASCAQQSITTTNTYEKAMPFSKIEIKKVEAEQEATCAKYSTKSNIRIKRMKEINASMNEQGLTQKQKTERYDYLMAHLNDGLEDSEQLKDKCDALVKRLYEMYEANHIAGDKYLDQRKRK
jgi:predicted transcriptional regulator